jgi:hypothetical protein
MSLRLDGSNGVTYNDGTTQNSSPFGQDQNYSNNLAGVSRFFNTLYTNTDTKPRWVTIGVTFPAASSQVTLLVDGKPAGYAGSSSVVIAGQICAPVPPGKTYIAQNTGAGATGTYWTEMAI